MDRLQTLTGQNGHDQPTLPHGRTGATTPPGVLLRITISPAAIHLWFSESGIEGWGLSEPAGGLQGHRPVNLVLVGVPAWRRTSE